MANSAARFARQQSALCRHRKMGQDQAARIGVHLDTPPKGSSTGTGCGPPACSGIEISHTPA